MRGVGAWLWHGYLGAGRMTLLTSQWKAGKTTLLANLVARMARGGTLAGLPVAAAKVAILSEEGPSNWEARCRKLSIGNHVSFFCRPFRGRPSPADWRGLLDSLLVLRREEGLDLVAIDPLAVFLPTGNENSATAMMDCLLPLQDLTAAGLCLLICHHPRKGTVQYGQAARGSGALPSLVDVLIEMKWHSSDGDDRRRWLRTFSRHEETPRTLLVELTAEGNDYLTHDIHHDEVSVQAGDVLFLVLEDATDRLTQRQILEQWPEDFPRPDQSTIARALKQGMAAGRILQKGTGRKNDPFLYWLAGKEEGFHPGPGASIEAVASWNDRLVTKWLATLGVPHHHVPQPRRTRPQRQLIPPQALVCNRQFLTKTPQRPAFHHGLKAPPQRQLPLTFRPRRFRSRTPRLPRPAQSPASLPCQPPTRNRGFCNCSRNRMRTKLIGKNGGACRHNQQFDRGEERLSSHTGTLLTAR